jgi:hypothetical protein
MPIHTTHTRDAALRQLHRINRWLIAGSVVLTGAFAEAAAHAFPGRTAKAASASKAKRAGVRTGSPSRRTTHSLQPPAHAPRATTEPSSSSPPTTPSQESPATSQAPAPERVPAQEAPPAEESAQAEEPAPARESAPAHESQPAEESAPAVSGGS